MAGKVCYDHLGNKFESVKEMCNYWEIDDRSFDSRIKRGWTIKRSLTTPMRSTHINIEYNGKIYKSKKELYKEYNIPYKAAIAREQRGQSINEIITDLQNYDIIEYQGKIFESLKDLCKEYNLSYSMALARKKRGWSIEKIITTPNRRPKLKNNIEYNGKIYKSKKELYKEYNIPYSVAIVREQMGWTIEKIITTPIRDNSKIVIDPITKNKCNVVELSKKYNVNDSSIYSTLSLNYSVIVALKISPTIQKRFMNINKSKYNLTVDKRIYKDKDIFECKIHNEDGSDTFRIMSYDMIDQYCLEQYKKLHNIV